MDNFFNEKSKYLRLTELFLNTYMKTVFQNQFAFCPKDKIKKLAEYAIPNCTPGTGGEYIEFLNKPFLNCKIHMIL